MKEKRFEAIVNEVENGGVISISDLCSHFNVSVATMRRDLRGESSGFGEEQRHCAVPTRMWSCPTKSELQSTWKKNSGLLNMQFR